MDDPSVMLYTPLTLTVRTAPASGDGDVDG
jgi:hypothetical protein